MIFMFLIQYFTRRLSDFLKLRFVLSGIRLLITIAAMVFTTASWAQIAGEELFQSTCAACHTIGGGRLVGPDLAGVTERRSQVWLNKFILSSQAMVKNGDADAVAVFEQFSGIVMPDFPLAEAQVTQLLAYIGGTESTADTVVDESNAEEPAPTEPLSMEHVLKGQELFQGTTRFENNGPSCNSCHDVNHDAVIGGGILAAELTTVFSKMGGTGVGAILGQAPFPVMQAAYKKNALTEDEITYLIAFLQNADEQHLLQQPRDYGMGLFVSGTVGAGAMYLLFAFIWRGRKRGTVYQQIFDRQVKSSIDNNQTHNDR
jgi:cytochrome c2